MYLVPNAISSTIKNRTEDWSAVFFRVELVEGKKDRERSSFFKTLRFYWRSGAHRAFLSLILFVFRRLYLRVKYVLILSRLEYIVSDGIKSNKNVAIGVTVCLSSDGSSEFVQKEWNGAGS